MSFLSSAIFVVGIIDVTIDRGPVTQAEALACARTFLSRISFGTSAKPTFTFSDSLGEHDIHFGGEAIVRVDSWTARVKNFSNSRRYYDNHKGLRKGMPRRIDTVGQATVAGLEWAKKLKIPKQALHPCGSRFTRRPTAIVGFEELPNGYRFLQGMPYWATIEIDVTDGTLIKYMEFPPRRIAPGKLGVEPESLRSKALSLYRAALTKIGEKKPNLANWLKVGYIYDAPKNKSQDPGKGRPDLYYKLGVVFFFQQKDGFDTLKDAVSFDADTGKLIEVYVRERPPQFPDDRRRGG